MNHEMNHEPTTTAPRDGASVTLRPVVPDDGTFLLKVYAGTRSDEVAAWGWDAAQQEAFFRMQFNAQQQAYEAEYPRADHEIILLGDEPVGRMIVERTERELRGVDIAMLPEYRDSGVGTALIKNLLAEASAADKPFRIQVVKSNRAMRLYERLGLSVIGESAFYFQMEWTPGARAADAPAS